MKQKDAIKIQEKLWRQAVDGKMKEYPERYNGIFFDIKGDILDVGGGPGTFMKFLGIKKATIVDLVGKNVLIDKNYKFIKRDLSKLLNLKKKYQTIFVMETLEHLYNPLYLMAQVYDILGEGGKCYISVPYTKLEPHRERGLGSHVSRWKKKELVDQLKKLGFRGRILQKRRRFKNTAFWLPHCWLVMELEK
jgi:2-polyprenyl-3-methyl-5-hydroxy-6-metoxy-1,4-benzoquinol methylase